MIKSNYSIKILKLIFNKIAKQLGKNMSNSKKVFRGTAKNSNDALATLDHDKKNSYELSNPQVKIFLTIILSLPEFTPYEEENCD